MSASSIPQHMKVLLLGSGGREHALAWKLLQSPRVDRLVVAPGNPGIGELCETRACRIEDPEDVLRLARELGADLVVVGPEAPLAAGIGDHLRAAGFNLFGPDRAAARLEWDKSFAKEFMALHNIPTASARIFEASDRERGREWIGELVPPVVLKASGLAAGKGVVIAHSQAEALEALDAMLSGSAFGDAGRRVVIEEYMPGEEASVFALCDGERYLLLPTSQDHKRAFDDDIGPNTGGMGAYAPAPVVDEALLEQVERTIIRPTLEGMRREATPYVGCLYVGLMVHEGSARVVEFNCRFGDPETQVVLPLLDGDLAELLWQAATGSIASSGSVPSHGAAACVVMASAGYPGSYEKGSIIEGLGSLRHLEQTVVFHAGTAVDGENIVTAGGRVLGVTAWDPNGSLAAAVDLAYQRVDSISFTGEHHRSDIGRRALERQP